MRGSGVQIPPAAPCSRSSLFESPAAPESARSLPEGKAAIGDRAGVQNLVHRVKDTVRWLTTDEDAGRATAKLALIGIVASWFVGMAITWLFAGRVSLNSLLICLAVPATVVPPHVYLYTRVMRRLAAARSAAAAEKERYRRLLADSMQGVLVHRDLKPLFANPAAARIGGFASVDDVLRLNSILEMVHPSDLPQFLAMPADQRALTGPIGPHRLRLRRPSGDLIAIEFHASAIDWDGTPARQVTFLDISEQVRAATLRDDFIATVSHEMRTPLTSIHGALGLARAQAAGAGDLPKLIAIAHDNSERLVRLLNDVLMIERFAAGRLALDLAPVACAPLLRDAIHQNQGLAAKLGIAVRLAPCPPVPDILGNRDALLQVLGNLLSNATKFSQAGGFVDVAMAAEGDGVRFCIRDRGPGITPEFRPHVFEKFMQARAAGTQAIGGSGLGLSICKMIVEQHGGEIGFESTPGERTDFFFTIPRQPAVSVPVAAPISAPMTTPVHPAGVTIH